MNTDKVPEDEEWTGEDCTKYEAGIISTHPPKLIAKAVLDGRVRCRCIPKPLVEEVNREIEQLKPTQNKVAAQTDDEREPEKKRGPEKVKTKGSLEK